MKHLREEAPLILPVHGIPAVPGRLALEGVWGLGGPTAPPPYGTLNSPLQAEPENAASCGWGWDAPAGIFRPSANLPCGLGRWMIGWQPCTVNLHIPDQAQRDAAEEVGMGRGHSR